MRIEDTPDKATTREGFVACSDCVHLIPEDAIILDAVADSPRVDLTTNEE